MSYHCLIDGDTRVMAQAHHLATDFIMRALRERARDLNLKGDKAMAYAHIQTTITVSLLTPDMDFCTKLNGKTYEIRKK